MDAIFFSKNNFNNILDTVDETIQNKYGKTIKEGSKYKHKLLDTMKKVYQNKGSFNISPLMTDDNIIVVLAQKTVKIFTMYLEQSIDYLPIVTNDIGSSEDTLNNYGALHMTGDETLVTRYSSTLQTFEELEEINNELVSFKDGKGKLFSGSDKIGSGGGINFTTYPPYRYDILIDLSGYNRYDIKFETGPNVAAADLQTIYIAPPHPFSCVDKIKINRLIVESPWENEDYLNKKFLEYKLDNASKQLSGAIVNLSGALDIYTNISGALKQTLVYNQKNRPINPNSAILVTEALFDLSGAKGLYENASGDLCTIVNKVNIANYFPPHWNNTARTCDKEKIFLNTYVSNLSGEQLEREIEISKNNFDLSVLETERLRVLLDTLSGSLDETGLSGETIRTWTALTSLVPNPIPQSDLTNIANISGAIIELNYENSKLEKEHNLEDIQTALFNLSGTVIDLSGLKTLRDNLSGDLTDASNNLLPVNLLYEVRKARYDYRTKASDSGYDDPRDNNRYLFNLSGNESGTSFNNLTPNIITNISLSRTSFEFENDLTTKFHYNNNSLKERLGLWNSGIAHVLMFKYTPPVTLSGIAIIENINIFSVTGFKESVQPKLGDLTVLYLDGLNDNYNLGDNVGLIPFTNGHVATTFLADYSQIEWTTRDSDNEIRKLRKAGHRYETILGSSREYFTEDGSAVKIAGHENGNGGMDVGGELKIRYETSLSEKNISLQQINDIQLEYNDASGKYFNKLYEKQQLESIYTGISGEYVNINSIYEFRRAVKNYKEFLDLSGQIGGVTNDLSVANTHMSNTLMVYNLDKTRFTYYDTSIKKDYANTLYTSVLNTHISGQWEIEDLDVAAQVKLAHSAGEVAFAQKLKLSAEQLFTDVSGEYHSYIEKDESVPYLLVKFRNPIPTSVTDDAYIISGFNDDRNNITALYPTNQISKWVHYTNEEQTIINYKLSAFETKDLKIALFKPDRSPFTGKCKLSISIKGYKI